MDTHHSYSNFISNSAISKIGFWSGILAFTAVVLFTIVQILQILNILNFPLDEILIYTFSLCITIPLLLEILALHHITKPDKKFFSHAALIFTVIYVVFVSANYVVQLGTVIPMTIEGNYAEINILRQEPHSLFWDFDAIGYISLGFATFFAAQVFRKKGFQKWVRICFLANSFSTILIVFVYFYPNFSENLLFIAIPWALTAPLSMVMLALMFKKILNINSNE